MMLPTDFWSRLWREIKNLIPLFRYLVLHTETHAFCLALSAAALVGFFPSCLAMLSILKSLLHWKVQFHPDTYELIAPPLPVKVMLELFGSFFTEYTGATNRPDRVFMTYNLAVKFGQGFANSSAWGSVLWVLLGAAAVFVPLEAGLNRLWQVHEDRPYWKNQIVGFALTLLCTMLALVFLLIASGFHWLLKFVPIASLEAVLHFFVNHGTMACLFIAVTLALYKLLPNRAIGVMEVLPAAVLAGILMEVVRMAYLGLAPNLSPQQGPFAIAVTFLLLVYFESFVILGCAFLASRRDRYPWIGFFPGLDSSTDTPPESL